jgi:uncharacterized protein YpbB
MGGFLHLKPTAGCQISTLIFEYEKYIHFFLQCQINNNLRNVLINNIKKYYANFDQLDFFSQLKMILIPDQEFLHSVVDYIKQSLELRK